MASRREQLNQILRLAAEEGIPVPADILLEIVKQDTRVLIGISEQGIRALLDAGLARVREQIADLPEIPEYWNARAIEGILDPGSLPLFTLTEPGVVPAPEKRDLILGSLGWIKMPKSVTYVRGGGAGQLPGPLQALAILPNALGWLYNDGLGNLVWSTPPVLGGDHALLSHLDFASSLHTGFAPAFVAGLANLVWATPNGAPGVPSLRALVAADIPALNYEPIDATIVRTGQVNWINLTDGGATTLHTHAASAPAAHDIVGALQTVTGAAGQVVGLSALNTLGLLTPANPLTTDTTLLLINDQTGTTYTLALIDKNFIVRCANAALVTVTVPTNAAVPFPVGSVVVIEKYGAGNVKIVPDATVTINSPLGCNTLDTLCAGASLVKTATNVWWLSGDLILG